MSVCFAWTHRVFWAEYLRAVRHVSYAAERNFRLGCVGSRSTRDVVVERGGVRYWNSVEERGGLFIPPRVRASQRVRLGLALFALNKKGGARVACLPWVSME